MTTISSEDRQRLAEREAQLLDRAELLLESGDIVGALEATNEAVSCCAGRLSTRTLQIYQRVLARSDIGKGSRSMVVRCFLQLDTTSVDPVAGPAARCWTVALTEVLGGEAEVRHLRNIVQSQKKKIETLESQIEQMKAVDLELEPPGPGNERP